MVDREKVIKGLECHVNGDPRSRCHKCPYWGTGIHGLSECSVMEADALELLKAQEPMKPIHIDKYTQTKPITFEYKCVVCCSGLMRHWVCCPNCGTAVKWDEVDK